MQAEKATAPGGGTGAVINTGGDTDAVPNRLNYTTSPPIAQVASGNGRGPQATPLHGADPDTLLTESADDEGSAQCVYFLYGEQFKYCDAYGWTFYNGRFWDAINADARLTRAIVDTLKRRRVEAVRNDREAIVKATKPSTRNVRQCQYLFQSLVSTDVSEFDKFPDLLNCQNGVVDLRTGRLTPHSPKQMFTYALPIAYDPNADMTPWTDFLADVLNDDQEMIQYLQTAIGYSLTGSTREEVMFYIHGPTRAGKGVFIETISTMMGKKPLAVEVDFGTFTATRDGDTQNFDLAPLKPCRFIAASESSKYRQLNAEVLKRVVGGNDIRCAYKRKTHFEYRPQFKVWLVSNYPVNADPDQAALWAKVRVITFPNSYLGRENKYLKEEMKQPDVLRGVLRWAIEGSIRWYGLPRKTGLVAPQQVADATEQARQDIDYVGQWLDEEVYKTDDPNDFVSNKTLYFSYETWCKESGVPPKKMAGLTASLKCKGYDAGVQKKIAGTNQRGCTGIELISLAGMIS